MKKSKELRQLDLAFCKASLSEGADSWVKHFDEKGKLVVKNGIVEGKIKIAEALKPLYNLEKLSFQWEPIEAFMSEDESLGVTMGHYERSYLRDDEEVFEEGYYTSIWTKTDDDKWKIYMDIGN